MNGMQKKTPDLFPNQVFSSGFSNLLVEISGIEPLTS